MKSRAVFTFLHCFACLQLPEKSRHLETDPQVSTYRQRKSAVTMEVNNAGTVPPPIDGDIESDNAESVDNDERKEKNEERTPSTHEKLQEVTMAAKANNTDTASPAIKADAAPPAVDNVTAKPNADSDLSDTESCYAESSSEEEGKNVGTPTLDKFGTNLTKLAQEGKLNPFVGREELVERVIQILCKRTKCSPCLIGHPGVWKTAIIEGLAQRIQSGNVPGRLKEKKIISIASYHPESGEYYPGMLMVSTIKEIKRSSDLIVFFDEGRTLCNASILKPALERGEIQCIGATNTLDEYTKCSSLESVFQAFIVPRPSVDDTIKILKGLRESYETHHKVRYTNEAFVAAVKLSSRYKSDRIFLDKAIGLIDEAGSRVQLLQAQANERKNMDQDSQLNLQNSTIKADTDHNHDDTPIIVTEEDVQHVYEEEMPMWTITLDKYGTNLTQLAQKGKLNTFAGREDLVERMIQVLCRQTKCSPCLIGHPSVLKTAIIEAFAQRIQRGIVPERLKGKKVIRIARCFYRTDIYQLGMLMTEEIERSDDIFVYFDEVGTSVFTFSVIGALVERDIQRCIAAVPTLEDYAMWMKKNPLLERAFQPILVPEPSVDDTIKILKGICGSYEIHHKVRYTDKAFVAAAELSNRYISDGILPDKAINLIDEAGCCARLQAQATERDLNNVDKCITVTEVDVQHVVSSLTGIPVHEVSEEESERLLKLEEALHASIIGQHDAVVAICDAIRRARAGLKTSKRPIASFIFAGPTGVGKTEVAKILARQYFGSEDSMVRFDMSEYMEKHQVSRLIGAPPGYIGCEHGGQLTDAVRRKPYTIVLFDEMEKAHSDVLNLMLQVLEDGRLTDNKGRTVDFSNTIIIMTSNIGSQVFEKIESSSGVPNKITKKWVMNEIKKYFRPEFLNRFDDIIAFKHLSRGKVTQIAGLMVKEVGETLKDKGIQLDVSDKFRDRVVKDGYSRSYGARELRRVLTTLLENFLARKILSKEIKEGDSIFVDVDSAGNIVLNDPSVVR